MSREERKRLKAERERLRWEIQHAPPAANTNAPGASVPETQGARSFCTSCGSMLYVGEAVCWKCHAVAPVPPPPPDASEPPIDGGSSAHEEEPALHSIDYLQLAYEQLGVTPSATDEEVKRAWKWQLSRLHPDLQQADEFARNIATQRSMQINAAYDAIRNSRGMN